MRIKRCFSIFLVLLLLAPAGFAANTATKHAAVSTAKAIVRSFAKGDFTTPAAKFTAEVKQNLSPRKIKQMWRQFTGNAGNFKGIGKVYGTPYHGDTIVFVKTLFAEKAFWTEVTLNQSGKVSEVYLRSAQLCGLPSC
jgi:hypothetical protein